MSGSEQGETGTMEYGLSPRCYLQRHARAWEVVALCETHTHVHSRPSLLSRYIYCTHAHAHDIRVNLSETAVQPCCLALILLRPCKKLGGWP